MLLMALLAAPPAQAQLLVALELSARQLAPAARALAVADHRRQERPPCRGWRPRSPCANNAIPFSVVKLKLGRTRRSWVLF